MIIANIKSGLYIKASLCFLAGRCVTTSVGKSGKTRFTSPNSFLSTFTRYDEASFKARYEPDKANAAATVSVNAGDFKLRASLTDGTVVNGPSLNGLSLAVEKPGFFLVDYNVPKKDFRFQFMNSVNIAEKPLRLTYIHSTGGAPRTILDGTLVVDSANKVSANHMLGTGNTKLKYTYMHNGVTAFEPSYDFGKNAWDFAVQRRIYGDDVVKATYQTSSKNLGLEWTRSSKMNGSFKITASVNLAEEQKTPNALRLEPSKWVELVGPARPAPPKIRVGLNIF